MIVPGAAAEAGPAPARVIVVSNQKGGTGKSTTAMHLIVGLLREGRSVASIDLDFHQASLTRYIENRRKFAASTKTDLVCPEHHRFALAAPGEAGPAPDELQRRFSELLDGLAAQHEVVVIDCPGSDTLVSRYAVSRADTLLTPMNDSFVDIDLLARFEGTPPRIIHIGHFAEMVWQQKKRRARRDGGKLDWVVIRNRYNPAASRNRMAVGEALDSLSQRLGFRIAQGFGERVIFRELFLIGLTMVDFKPTEPLIARSPSHLAAHEEARALIGTVRIPEPVKPDDPSRPKRAEAAKVGEAGEAPSRANGRLFTAEQPPGDEAPAAISGQRNLLVIYNPVGGWRQQRRFRATLRRLAVAGSLVTVLETSAKGEAEALAHSALDEGFAVIVAAGGDGTINEVANALTGSGNVMGILPLGTLNVLAAEIGLPSDPKQVAQVIAAGKPRKVHLGTAGERHFLIAAGVGFDAMVADKVGPFSKRLFGRFAYVLHSALQLIAYRATRYTVIVDGQEFLAAGAVIANGHYYAGRLAYAPEARLDDPRLHVCLLARPVRWNVLRYRFALMMGRLPRLPDVQVLPARKIEIRGDDADPVHADGEIVGHLPIRFDAAQQEITILAPG